MLKRTSKLREGNEWIRVVNAIRKKIGEKEFTDALQKREQLNQHLLKVLNLQNQLSYEESKKLIYDLFKDEVPLQFGNIQSIIVKEKQEGGYAFYIEEDGKQKEIFPVWIPNTAVKNVTQYLISIDEYEQLQNMLRGEQEDDEESDKKLNFTFYDIVKDAYNQKASDIHISYSNDGTYRVGFRIDGILIEQNKYIMQERDGLTLIRSIKNEATKYTKGRFNADKSFIPQDARIVYDNIGGFGLDLRLVFIPNGTLEKEMAVARLLERKVLKEPDFKKMGYFDDIVDILDEVSLMANGLVIVSGQTGSGKSTLLNNIITGIPITRKVNTAEDPIEYLIMKPNVVQHQVYIPPANDDDRANKIMGFKELAKAFKRADPDVVLIGETRKDPELIETLIEMSEAGQLVFTTVHIASAFGIYTALENAFGMEKDVSIPIIKLSVNQSLSRKLCPYCKKRDKENTNRKKLSEIKSRIRFIHKKKLEEFLDSETETYVSGGGCEHCHNGYIGRVPVYEYLYPTVEFREWLSEKNRTPIAIEKKACEEGLGKNKLTTFIENMESGLVDTNPENINKILL